jgi:hypothetical protein
MNPFLEQDDAWHDFHEKFLPAVAERLVPRVRPDYIVKIDEHVYVHELPHEPRRLLGRADVSVAPSSSPAPARPVAGVLEAPARVSLPAPDFERLSFVEIRDRHSRELVTVIELLSPSNKRPGADRDQYLAKRQTLLNSRVHLVEIDLLRGGRPMPLDGRPDCSYSILVSRSEDRPQAGFWPLSLRDRLPVVPVPLRAPHGDVPLDLQDVLDRIYDTSSYADYLYEGSPEPPLKPDDEQWAIGLLSGPR